MTVEAKHSPLRRAERKLPAHSEFKKWDFQSSGLGAALAGSLSGAAGTAMAIYPFAADASSAWKVVVLGAVTGAVGLALLSAIMKSRSPD